MKRFFSLSIFQLNNNPLKNGLKLAIINGLLSVFCILIFLFCIFLLFFFSFLSNYNIDLLFPFPLPLVISIFLFVGFIYLFLYVWVHFARRLSDKLKVGSLKTALIGASPFFVLALFGYGKMLWIQYLTKRHPRSILDTYSMPGATSFVAGLVATLALLAAMTCLIIIALITNRRDSNYTSGQ